MTESSELSSPNDKQETPPDNLMVPKTFQQRASQKVLTTKELLDI